MKEDMVYLMGRENTDYVKIGITDNIDRRISQLKGKFKDIEILSIYVCPDRKNAVDLEKNLHSFLHHKRIQHEWFILQIDEILALHEAIILFYKVRSHKFELMERENTWLNRFENIPPQELSDRTKWHESLQIRIHEIDPRIPILEWKRDPEEQTNRRYYF